MMLATASAKKCFIKQAERVTKQINELKKDYKKFNEYFNNADNISDFEFKITKTGKYRGVCIYLKRDGLKARVDTCKRIVVLSSYRDLVDCSLDSELREMLDKKFNELYSNVR